jgi:serine phosphatase RsbU (regulator of sigma subunit)
MGVLDGFVDEHQPDLVQEGAELTSLRADVDALSEELLNRYEEVTLLYDLSRELGVVLDVESAAQTALVRTLQVIPAQWGMVVVGSGVDDLVDAATAGDAGPDGRYAELAHSAAGVAMRLVAQVMVHAGGSMDRASPPVADPVLAVPLITGEENSAEVGATGVLVLVGHGGDDRFSAGDAQLAAAVARQLSLGVENARIVAELRAKEGLERDLELAAGMQRSLLPAYAPKMTNASLAAACLPAAHVGGDYYDFVSGDDGVVHAIVADVTGHGPGPGLIMAMTRSVLRAELRGPRSLPAALASTNAVMWDDLVATAVFITLFAVQYESASRRLRYVNCGHHPALLRHPDGSVEELDSDGMPLGLLPDPPYEEGEQVLEPGALVMIFSDGIVEARDPDATMYGTARLLELVAKAGNGSAEDLVTSVLDDLDHFRAGAAQDDDVTLVVLRVDSQHDGDERLPA